MVSWLALNRNSYSEAVRFTDTSSTWYMLDSLRLPTLVLQDKLQDPMAAPQFLEHLVEGVCMLYMLAHMPINCCSAWTRPYNAPHGSVGVPKQIAKHIIWNVLARSHAMTFLYPGKSVPGLAQNPVCRAAGGCKHVVPLRMFVDGVGYQGRNSFTLWTLGSILNEQATVIAALRSQDLCDCGCRGRHTKDALEQEHVLVRRRQILR